MTRQSTTGDRRSTRPAMLLGERGDEVSSSTDDRPRIESDGRYAAPSEDQPPDPRAVIEDLRKQLRIEQEKSMNATDAVMGARAIAAQARAETQDTYYRLHVREVELEQLKELLDEQSESPRGNRPITPAQRVGSTGPVGGGAVESATSAARSLLSAIKRAVME